MTRDEVIALIVRKAKQYDIEPYEFLGGAVAESDLDPNAERWGTPPDISFGLFQQTVQYADEGDHSHTPENIALIQRLYSDPEHACNVAAAKYRYWRHDPDVEPLTAWVAYNGPLYYRTPEQSPNVENYRRGLAEAQRILGAASMLTRVTYNANEPAIPQPNGWSCAPTSLAWAMRSLGRKPTALWVANKMVDEGYVTEADGLKDATGAGLAAFAREWYGEYGFDANYERSVTFDGAALEGGHAYPILIGGRAFNHWVGVRDFDAARGLLLLANPSEGWEGVGQTMSHRQFDALGPFSMVRVFHPDLLSAPAPAPIDPMIAIRESVAAVQSALDSLKALVSS